MTRLTFSFLLVWWGAKFASLECGKSNFSFAFLRFCEDKQLNFSSLKNEETRALSVNCINRSVCLQFYEYNSTCDISMLKVV